MAEEDKKELGGSHGIRIDYDSPDVEDIMGQIREGIASRPEAASPAAAVEPQPEPPSPVPPPPELEPLPLSGARRLLLRLMRPFAPLIKLLILPVHQDFLETVHRLDHTNRRLDFLYNLGRTMEYTKLLHSLSHNMVVELSKLKIEEEDIKVKARILDKDFEFLRSKERALEERVMK
jgi:hypothetical protein